MKKIYFAASIRGGREERNKYKKIIDMLKEKNIVLTEHIGLESLNEEGMTDKEIYSRDIKWLEESDLVICEASVVSLGVGYELAYSEKINKETHVLYKIGSEKKLSAMITGDNFFHLHYYKNDEELGKIIKQIVD